MAPSRIGRYRLTRVLGVGMFSRVMLGIDDETGGQYAVKIMHKDRLEALQMESYARREALVLHKVRHPNIVELVEAIQSPKKLFLIMRVAPGRELLDVVSTGALSESDARHYARQLCDAVSHLHAHAYCHRDIKPENVLVDTCSRKLVLIDLGLAGVIRRYSPMLTACGSAHYSAPEATFGAANGYDGAKADAWSIGVLVYIMLTGVHPFVDAEGELLLEDLRSARVDFPDHLPSPAVAFISSLLALSPRRRYTVTQALSHPWLRASSDNPCTSSEPTLSSHPDNIDRKRSRKSMDRRASSRRSGTSTSFSAFFPRASLYHGDRDRDRDRDRDPRVSQDASSSRRTSRGSTSSFAWFRRVAAEFQGEDEMEATRAAAPGARGDNSQSFGNTSATTQQQQRPKEEGLPHRSGVHHRERERSSSLMAITAQAFSSIALSFQGDRAGREKRENQHHRQQQHHQSSRASQERVRRQVSFSMRRRPFLARKTAV